MSARERAVTAFDASWRRYLAQYGTAGADHRVRRRSVLQFLSDHQLICLVVAVATLVRIIVMLAYPPAFWFPDSLPYVQAALRLTPYFIRPVGYSFLLYMLEPAHSVLLVTLVQHAMGVIVGVEVYAVLRRRQLPSWAATLAAVPPLLSVYAIQIEHYVLSDTLFGFLVTSAMVLLLWWPRPPVWACAAAGLLLAWATVDRSQGTLLIVPFGLYLAIAGLGIRRFCACAAAMAVAFLVPVIGYAWWFQQTYGVFDLTTSDGAFLYSRVAVFAECPTIRPPADERWLCVSTPVSKRPAEAWYVWAAASPINHAPTADLRGKANKSLAADIPAGSEFSPQVDRLATNFAERAILAQPVTYLRITWDATVEAFMPQRDTNRSTRQYVFPDATPKSVRSIALSNGENYRYVYTYNGGANPDTTVVEPFASISSFYQSHFALAGPLLGFIVLVGLIGLVRKWRRLGDAVTLPWLTGLVLIVTPAATADFDSRYVVAAVPAFCLAAGLAFAGRTGGNLVPAHRRLA